MELKSLMKSKKGQLGLEPTFDLYIKHLCDIFDEIKRVLRKDGTCWVNLGDTYSGGGRSGSKEYFEKGHKHSEETIKKLKKKCPRHFLMAEKWDIIIIGAKVLIMIHQTKAGSGCVQVGK